MTDPKQEPPKAADGSESSAQNPAPEGTPAAVPSQPAAVTPKPAAAAPPKPAAAVPPKPPAPKAPVKPDPWTSPLLEQLQKKFPGAVSEPVIFRNLPCVTIAKEHLVSMCQYLKSSHGGAYTLLTDETAVDYPKREKRFDIIYLLYSFERNDRLRLRVVAGEGEKVPSVAGVWVTANWLEREVFDMFGVEYEGHPDMKRLLLPEEWVGHPLRKDYDIIKQDAAWVKANLGIESAQ